MTPCCVLHIPHSSTIVPSDLRGYFKVNDDRLKRELLCMTDWYTDEIFALDPMEAITIRFPVSRLVLDPERYLEDEKEIMASRGMGLIYTRDSEGRILRDGPSREERRRLVSRFYEPHHAALAQAVRMALDQHAFCLLIDCHSFPSQPLPCDIDQTPDRPDACIGTVPFHTPGWLEDMTADYLRGAGLSVGINQPYSGAMVPDQYNGREISVNALMLEINRRLYLDEGSGEKLSSFSQVSEVIHSLLRKLLEASSSRVSA